MTLAERKILTDTITNLHNLAKSTIELKTRLIEAEKQIILLQRQIHAGVNRNEKIH